MRRSPNTGGKRNKPGRDLDYTRYDKMAEALGCYAEYVEEPEAIRLALHRAWAEVEKDMVGFCQRQDRLPRPCHDRAFLEPRYLSGWVCVMEGASRAPTGLRCAGDEIYGIQSSRSDETFDASELV